MLKDLELITLCASYVVSRTQDVLRNALVLGFLHRHCRLSREACWLPHETRSSGFSTAAMGLHVTEKRGYWEGWAGVFFVA
uniref:Uncharacterized protein n=1 Tax=Arundo donax TaxID=35708 RepID=A0A0A8YK86_ARUDO